MFRAAERKNGAQSQRPFLCLRSWYHIDFLYTFADNPGWSLFDLVRMDEELAAITGRPVDLVDRKTIEHSEKWIRRRETLGSAEVISVAR